MLSSARRKAKGLTEHRDKDQKQKIRESFQRKFDGNFEFDAYIESQFKKMLQEKKQNPTLMIPQGFRKFLQSKSFKQLLKRVYDYMQCLVEYEHKYEQMASSEGPKITSDPLFRPFRYQSTVLEQKCKEISYAYMGILLGYGDNRMIFKDQYFFETMIYFLTQVLRQNFEQGYYAIVEEELNRIFRTNAFNLIRRRNLEDEILSKYPAMKEHKYDSTAHSVTKLENRLRVHKKNNYSVQLKQEPRPRVAKPIEIQLSTFHSIKSRSPLIATFYPSERQKLHYFSKEVREKQSFFKSQRRAFSFRSESRRIS